MDQGKAQGLQQKAALVQPPEAAVVPPAVSSESGEQENAAVGVESALNGGDSQAADHDQSEEPGGEPA
jgi:hypothetical protein